MLILLRLLGLSFLLEFQKITSEIEIGKGVMSDLVRVLRRRVGVATLLLLQLC